MANGGAELWSPEDRKRREEEGGTEASHAWYKKAEKQTKTNNKQKIVAVATMAGEVFNDIKYPIWLLHDKCLI